MQGVTVNARGKRRCAMFAMAAAAMLVSCCVAPSRAAAQDAQPPTANAGRIWYEKYCTPCHGQGGAPGSAVFVASKQPVDLRTYVQRHDGKFPTGDWLSVVFGQPPHNLHTAIWERIQRDEGGTGSEPGARGKVRSIAEYILSIQAK